MGIPAVDHEPWHDDLLSRLCAGREPPVPVAEVAELLDAAANDTLSHADLVDVISQSPALRLSMLILANGPVWGRFSPARTVDEAVRSLGRRGCAQAATWLAVTDLCGRASAMSARGRDRLWRHLMLTGWLSRELANGVCEIPYGDPLVAGMVHDVGHVLLTSPAARLGVVWHDEHEAVIDRMDDVQLDLDHTRVGASLLDLWGAPAELVSSALHHHAPQGAIPYFQPLIATVRLADLVAEKVESSEFAQGWSLREEHGVESLVRMAGADDIIAVEAVCITALPEAILQVDRWADLRPSR